MPEITCDNTDSCEPGTTHWFPEVGEQVRVTEDYTARIVGGEEELSVPKGSEGLVMGYVPEWHDVDVAFGVLDDERVWIDPEFLTAQHASGVTRQA